MRNELEDLVEAELHEMSYVIAEFLKIPSEIFNQHGLSALSVALYENMGDEYSQAAEQARQSFDLLCGSAPRVPRAAIKSISLAYAQLSNIFDSRSKYGGDLSAVKSLVSAAGAKGMVMGLIYGDPNTTEIERRKMLSVAGTLGSKGKHSGTNALKAWAIERASTMSGSDKDIARKLAGNLPEHLKKASKDPERFIYDALRALAKPN